MTIRFLTSGESHGKCLNAIIEGIGAGFELDYDFINNELKNRQQGKGRGGRMKIETDKIKIKSGVRFAKTTGAPICLEINNRDFENWKIPMSVEKIDFDSLDKEIQEEIKSKSISLARPGHADLSGAVKYNQDDIRNILERSSARETATRVAVGAICQDILKKFEIKGMVKSACTMGKTTDSEIENAIDEAKKLGESLGGHIDIEFTGVPIGLGSFVHWDRRLDGKLAQAIMSIPAVKSVEIGLGKDVADKFGSSVHDEIFYENGKIVRHTNNAGGIEGGMTNGENIVIKLAMKPIPTMKKTLKSIDINSLEQSEAHFERADTSAVEACGTVALNMAAIVLLDAFFEKFGSDNFDEVMNNFQSYKKYLQVKLEK